MPRRRASREGTVFKLPDGRWAAVLELPRHPNGKRNRRKKEAQTQAEAQQLLKQMRRDLDQFGQLPETSRTVNQTLDDYVDQVLKPKESGKSTNIRSEGFCGAISAFFGDRKTADLSVVDVDSFLRAFAGGQANASGRPIGRDYVKRARAYLINALKNDMRLGYINRNVAELSVLPTTTRGKAAKRALTVEEWRKLYDAATGVAKLSIDLSGRHGLRPQEARSIRWSDLDLDLAVVSVVNQFDSDDEFVAPKTSDSARTIKLHPETVELLAHWRTTQDTLRRRAGKSWTERELVLTTKFGTAIRQENNRRSLRALCQRLGINPITPYELRHTAITHQVDDMGSAGPVADWAGTSEAMIRRHYRHNLREVSPLDPMDYMDT